MFGGLDLLVGGHWKMDALDILLLSGLDIGWSVYWKRIRWWIGHYMVDGHVVARQIG